MSQSDFEYGLCFDLYSFRKIVYHFPFSNVYALLIMKADVGIPSLFFFGAFQCNLKCLRQYLQAEFMEHDEKHLPIDIRLLGALAEKVLLMHSCQESFLHFNLSNIRDHV